jgi:type I restriction enzyme M protein
MRDTRPVTTKKPGLEQALFLAADKLRSNLDAADYKHVVLGLVFLKFVGGAAGGFVVAEEARWSTIAAAAKTPGLGARIDAAMAAIERDNPGLAGAPARRYDRPELDARRLGELVALIDGIGPEGLGIDAAGGRDVLGRVYEYFLGQFARAEGKKGGQFYTPRCVVELLVGLLSPRRGTVYDPCCGTGGMFVQCARLGGAELCLFGQESNPTTWRLARMNLALRGLRGDLGPAPADTFARDLFPELRADVVLANPPFNDGDWGGAALQGDPRWAFGAPPAGSANFAWLQHVVHHLAPGGRAGVVLANGSLSSRRSGEGEIRRRLVEAGLVECIIALPGQLFYSTQIPACVWLLAKGRARPDALLFVDARAMGAMIGRTQRALGAEEIVAIAEAVRAWRGEGGPYRDVPGFCRAARLPEVERHGFVLTPGRYVGEATAPAPAEAPAERLRRLSGVLEAQIVEGARLDAEVLRIVRSFGDGG